MTTRIIDPSAGGSGAKIQLARRPMDLRGKIVGFIDNTKEQADVIAEAMAEGLQEKYGVAKVIIRRKPYFSKPAPVDLLEELAKEVDVAIAAVGG
jgi:predicted GTPase